MGEIYALTNMVNGKMYIGQTEGDTFIRWKQHISESKRLSYGSLALNNAIRKYSSDSFYVEILEIVEDSDNLNDKLDELEIANIKDFDTLCPNGYNIQTGGKGKGRKHCQESRERMRQSKLGAKNHNFGKPRTKETKIKISLAKSGVKHHFYGQELSESHKLALSKSHKSKTEYPDLPMYICYLLARPKYYQDEGFVVVNHPCQTKSQYFTSKKYTMEEKLTMAKKFLNSLNN
jgi:group I intron endonuclease